MRGRRQGFTMTEIVVALLITGVGLGLFHTVFVSNWVAYEDRIKRANLWNEANDFFEALSIEGRNARQIDITTSASTKTASFTNAVDNSVTSFNIDDTGKISSIKGSVTKEFSKHAVFADCTFVKSGKNLLTDLRLKEKLPNREIQINSSIEILPRN